MDEFLIEASELLHEPLFSIGKSNVTLYGIAATISLLLVIIVSERLFRRFIVKRMLAETKLDEGVRYGIERIIGYLFIILGFYIALQTIGLDLSSLALLAGAVGVGLGFGLQSIFSNFMSGLVILAERPISIGDRIDVAGVAGQVVKINWRSTIVVTNDNISIIVPMRSSSPKPSSIGATAIPRCSFASRWASPTAVTPTRSPPA